MTAQHEICPACRVKLQRKLADALGIDLAGKIDWNQPQKPLWVGSVEAARLLGISTKTLESWRKSGRLNVEMRKIENTWQYKYADLEK